MNVDKIVFNQAAMIDAADRIVKERNSADRAYLDGVLAKKKDLQDIVDLAIAACEDNSPKLAKELKSRADAIF